MRAAQFLATIGRGSKGSNALEVTEDRAGATSEQQDNVINTVNSLDPYGPSWQLVPGNVAAGTVYAQVPTNGLGDLQFTRASDATRTNSAGVIERTPWNLLTFSEMFSDVAWSKTMSGAGIAPIVTPNTSNSPIGTLTADRIQFNRVGTTISDRSILLQNFGSAIIGRPYTFSIYIKANAPSEVGKQLRLIIEQGGAFEQIITINAEWTRYTFFAPSAGATNPNCIIETRGTVTANITVDVLVWGAQLVEGTDAKPYFATTNRQDVPRLDYRNADGTLSSCPRLLLEPQRTNGIRNSTMVGAVAGSPGTLPTNWSLGTGGLTPTIVGTGTENGLQYIDIRFNGTATTVSTEIRVETITQIAASNGQTWSNSLYAKIISGSITSYIGVAERTSAGGFVVFGSQAVNFTSALARYNYIRTLSGGATVGVVQPVYGFNLTIGATYDFTIRIAAPQMELGAYATTFIPTTTAAVTRLADSLRTASGATSLFNSTWTAFGELIIPARGTSGTATGFGLRSTYGSNNPTDFVYNTVHSAVANSLDFQWFVSGIATKSVTVAITYGTRIKFAVTSDGILYVNGVQISASSSLTPATPVEFAFGRLGQVDASNGEAESVAQASLFKSILTPAKLAAITTL